MSQLTGWLNQSRSVYQGAYNTQAQVMASLPADTANVQTLLADLGILAGALGAIQAGNQLNGQVASQLMKMNSQMATTNQAQLNWIAQQTQMIAQAQNHIPKRHGGLHRSEHRDRQRGLRPTSLREDMMNLRTLLVLALVVAAGACARRHDAPGESSFGRIDGPDVKTLSHEQLMDALHECHRSGSSDDPE